jgi:hypothetical protein
MALGATGLVYVVFAAACFRLAIEHGYERGVSLGEGSFVLLGAAGLLAAAVRARLQAAIVAVATLPLVGWFLATRGTRGRRSCSPHSSLRRSPAWLSHAPPSRARNGSSLRAGIRGGDPGTVPEHFA